MSKKRYQIYAGSDNPNSGRQESQIRERYHGGYRSLAAAELELQELRDKLKASIIQADEKKECVRYFVYILGYDNKGIYRTLNQVNYQTKKYCEARNIPYEQVYYN